MEVVAFFTTIKQKTSHLVAAKSKHKTLLLSPSWQPKKKKKGLRERVYLQAPALGPASSSHLGHVLSWLPLQPLLSSGDGVSTKSSEVGRREKILGREEAEKTKNSG
jgi:hypothetical protein